MVRACWAPLHVLLAVWAHAAQVASSNSCSGDVDWRSKFDWKIQNKVPPWLSNIRSGSPQGVAIVLGQSLQPDGSPAQVLLDRALKARELLDAGKVVKVIVSGGDPSGVGHTEAWEAAHVLMRSGIPQEAIIMETQATTTAENAWFSLRWIPEGTGHFYLVTSDFHMSRATYIFQAVFEHFYRTWEERFKDDPAWMNPVKRYPRMQLHQVPTKSFCGSNSSAARGDHDPSADINLRSLRRRALDELRFLGSGEVGKALYGQPLWNNHIWGVQINVSLDPQSEANFKRALAQSMNTAQALCRCVAPPDPSTGQKRDYPLTLPARTEFPSGRSAPEAWQQVVLECKRSMPSVNLLQEQKDPYGDGDNGAATLWFVSPLVAAGLWALQLERHVAAR